MTSATPSPLTLDEIQSELAECDSATERLEYLIELGDTLPPFPDEARIEANRVLGCQSSVWLVVEPQSSDKLSFLATSDAPMVRGLIAILLAAYSRKTADEILNFDIEAYFQRIDLRSFITPMRSNGLHSMVLKVRSFAEASRGNEPHATDKSPHSRSRLIPTRSLQECRRDFPIFDDRQRPPLTYFDNAASSQRPIQVLEAMEKVYREHYSNVHRSGHSLAARTTTALENSRRSLARFINAESVDEIVYTSGTTASINLVARAWGDANVKSGDTILLTEMEHHSNIVPWQQLSSRTGATIEWCPFTSDYQLDLEQLTRLLSHRVKLLAITAVSNVFGTINPIEKIVSIARKFGTTVLVDAAQSVPHGRIDVQNWDADFVAFSGHKMLGPTGIGVLYGKRSLLESMPPFMGGGNMIHSVDLSGFAPAPIPHRFEAGTAPIVEAIAMEAAVQYIESLGDETILDHERLLAGRMLSRIAELPRVRHLGPDISKKNGVVSFVVEGMHADDVSRFLDAENIAIRVGHHCTMPLHKRLGIASSCRASVYCYNTIQEVDRFCDVLHRIAR